MANMYHYIAHYLLILSTAEPVVVEGASLAN